MTNFDGWLIKRPKRCMKKRRGSDSKMNSIDFIEIWRKMGLQRQGLRSIFIFLLTNWEKRRRNLSSVRWKKCRRDRFVGGLWKWKRKWGISGSNSRFSTQVLETQIYCGSLKSQPLLMKRGCLRITRFWVASFGIQSTKWLFSSEKDWTTQVSLLWRQIQAKRCHLKTWK